MRKIAEIFNTALTSPVCPETKKGSYFLEFLEYLGYKTLDDMQITRTHVSIDLGWQQYFVTGKHCITQSPGWSAAQQTLKKQLNLIPFWPAVHRFLAYEDLAISHSSLFL